MNPPNSLILAVVFNLLMPLFHCGKVIEMDDRLVELSAQGKWLVTFYAPWCGHCRKLEPVMEEVAKQLGDKSITIVKIDATRFYKAANHFDIKAYPTIKFVNGQKLIDYHGERRKPDIIEFLSRADSEHITKITNQIDFEKIQIRHKHFFLLVSADGEANTKLVKEFYELADLNFLDAYFYHASPEMVSGKVVLEHPTPKVSVFKEDGFENYDTESYESLAEFIRNERFVAFTEITMTNLRNLIETRKTLIVLNLNTKDKHQVKQTKKLMDNYSKFSRVNRKLNHKDFQFGYVDNSDLLNGIAIWTLPSPLLFIFNTSSYTYAFQEVVSNESGNKAAVIDLDIQELLDEIKLGRIEWYGGQTYFRTLRRPFWELYRAVIEMFFEAPFLSLLIFGFPFGVISIVFYFLCCVDANEEMDEDYLSNSDSNEEVNEEDYYIEDELEKDSAETFIEGKKTQ